MRAQFGFWMAAGTGTGAAAGMYYDKLAAGLCFGSAAGLIATIITWLNIYQRNNK